MLDYARVRRTGSCDLVGGGTPRIIQDLVRLRLTIRLLDGLELLSYDNVLIGGALDTDLIGLLSDLSNRDCFNFIFDIGYLLGYDLRYKLNDLISRDLDFSGSCSLLDQLGIDRWSASWWWCPLV